MKDTKLFWISKEETALGRRYKLAFGYTTIAIFRRDMPELVEELNKAIKRHAPFIDCNDPLVPQGQKGAKR